MRIAISAQDNQGRRDTTQGRGHRLSHWNSHRLRMRPVQQKGDRKSPPDKGVKEG